MSESTYTTEGKPFERDMDYIDDRILAGERSADPDDRGPRDVKVWPVEPGRYRLVAARACPWANRAIIVRHCSASRTSSRGARPVRRTMRAAGPSTSTRTVATPCSG